VAELVEVARIYRHLLGARIRSDLQYRTSFVLFTIGQFLVTFVDFLVVLVLFEQVPSFEGWEVAEVAFLYGVSCLAFAAGDLFVSQIEYLPEHIRIGSFDRILLRPLGPLLQLSSEEFALRRIGKFAQALLVLAVALATVDVDWSPARVVMVPVMTVSGAVIFGSIWVAFSTITFWSTESREVVNSFTYGGNFLSQYPLEIYSPWLRRLFAIVVPIAFVNYFPALYVLDKDDPFGAPAFVDLLSPLVAVVMVLVARAAWRNGIRHYRSTGS
jgi:ABC-2 type transport system permease protein